MYLLREFVKDESGATAIEYALIAAGIGLAIITAVNALGGHSVRAGGRAASAVLWQDPQRVGRSAHAGPGVERRAMRPERRPRSVAGPHGATEDEAQPRAVVTENTAHASARATRSAWASA